MIAERLLTFFTQVFLTCCSTASFLTSVILSTFIKMSAIELKMSVVPVELLTLHSLQLATVAFIVLAFAAKFFFGPQKLGKALPTPGGMSRSRERQSKGANPSKDFPGLVPSGPSKPPIFTKPSRHGRRSSAHYTRSSSSAKTSSLFLTHKSLRRFLHKRPRPSQIDLR